MNKRIVKELEPLSVMEKLDVIEFLTESIDSHDVPLTEAQRLMVLDREKAYKAGSSTLVSWNEVRNSTNE